MNAKTNVNSGDPAELERAGENIRADMDETLEALEQKFSPGQAMDRSLQFLREHGGEISREVTSAVRENPVPLLLTAVGLTWFTMSMIRSRSSSYSSDYESYNEDSTSFGSGEDGSNYESDYGYAEGNDTAEGLRGRAAQVKNKARRKLGGALSSARGQTRRVNQQLHGLIREQPLALGALAMAAGAILGAALPATEYERQTARPIRDRAIARAEEIGQRGYDSVRSALKSNGEQQQQGNQSAAT